eukprot:1138640-Pelagomonas_calceolata.AAC.9
MALSESADDPPGYLACMFPAAGPHSQHWEWAEKLVRKDAIQLGDCRRYAQVRGWLIAAAVLASALAAVDSKFCGGAFSIWARLLRRHAYSDSPCRHACSDQVTGRLQVSHEGDGGRVVLAQCASGYSEQCFDCYHFYLADS